MCLAPTNICFKFKFKIGQINLESAKIQRSKSILQVEEDLKNYKISEINKTSSLRFQEESDGLSKDSKIDTSIDNEFWEDFKQDSAFGNLPSFDQKNKPKADTKKLQSFKTKRSSIAMQQTKVDKK